MYRVSHNSSKFPVEKIAQRTSSIDRAMMSQKSKNKSSEPDIAARISTSELISAKQRFDHVTTEIPVLPTTPQEFITINWCFHKVASYRTNFMAATNAFFCLLNVLSCIFPISYILNLFHSGLSICFFWLFGCIKLHLHILIFFLISCSLSFHIFYPLMFLIRHLLSHILLFPLFTFECFCFVHFCLLCYCSFVCHFSSVIFPPFFLSSW